MSGDGYNCVKKSKSNQSRTGLQTERKVKKKKTKKLLRKITVNQITNRN